MMPDNPQSATPLSDKRKVTHATVTSVTFLPESIEAAMKHYEVAIGKMFLGKSSSETVISGPEKDALVQAIATALAQAREDSWSKQLNEVNEQLQALRNMPPMIFGENPELRERCERLRKIVVAESEAEDECDPPDFVYDVWKANYRESDLADDLQPAQESAT